MRLLSCYYLVALLQENQAEVSALAVSAVEHLYQILPQSDQIEMVAEYPTADLMYYYK